MTIDNSDNWAHPKYKPLNKFLGLLVLAFISKKTLVCFKNVLPQQHNENNMKNKHVCV
jgi:hypothetical protein